MRKIPLYLGHEHDCGYLPGQQARTAYVGPETRMNGALYSALAQQGFRRSGDLVYRPYCSNCSACVPVRIPVARFIPNRSQTRVSRRNADLTVIPKPAAFEEAHYRLFSRYLEARHAEGGMASSNRDEYIEFLSAGWAQTSFVEFRLDDALLAVAVVDHLPDALSAVYTFYDPDCGDRSLGVCAVLWQIREARRSGLSWLYLGFWIEGCRKMAYKDHYRPLEAFIAGQWRAFEKGEKIRP
jgi:arginine-tRNA-protein transferase